MRGIRQSLITSQKAMNSLPDARRMIDSMKPIAPLAGHRNLMESMKPVDPLADYRRLVGSMKLTDPMAESRRLMEAWKAQPAFDAIGEYQRIMRRASNLSGAAFAPPKDESVPTSDSSPGQPASWEPPASLVVALVGIAWTCAWMVATGADVNSAGSLFIEAVALALYFNEKTN